jgi:hypothetical protein
MGIRFIRDDEGRWQAGFRLFEGLRKGLPVVINQQLLGIKGEDSEQCKSTLG